MNHLSAFARSRPVRGQCCPVPPCKYSHLGDKSNTAPLCRLQPELFSIIFHAQIPWKRGCVAARSSEVASRSLCIARSAIVVRQPSHLLCVGSPYGW